MDKIFVVARREYLANVRTKAFIISLVLMPILMGGGALLQMALKGRVDLKDRKLVVIDQTGRLYPILAEAAERRNREDIFDPETGRQTDPKFVVERYGAGDLTDDQRFELSEKARNDEIAAFVEIRAAVFEDSAPAATSGAAGGVEAPEPPIRFHSEHLSNDLQRWFSRTITQAVAAERLREAGLDPLVVARATAPVRVDVVGLYSRAKSGEIRKADEAGRMAAFFVPMAVMMLMFVALMLGQTMLQSALEEKQQRIAEVLLGSARPFELMMGKLLGNVAVSMTMVAFYMAGGFWLTKHLGFEHLLPVRLVGWFIAYQILGVMLYGAAFIAIGAACTELKEAQNYLMPVMLVLVAPMMVWFMVLEEPTSTFATWLSLFPPSTPMLMLLRMSATTAVPTWQPALGIVLTLLTTVAVIWAAGRVFRIGLLMQGKPPKIRELAAWVIRG